MTINFNKTFSIVLCFNVFPVLHKAFFRYVYIYISQLVKEDPKAQFLKKTYQVLSGI